MNPKTAAISLLLTLICAFYLLGQDVAPLYTNYTKYTTADGLPQDYVSYIAQDQDGFIWVATLNGLARFDGHEFIRFDSRSGERTKLSTSQVYDILIDDSNNLWILNFNYKVDRMDPRTFEVIRDVQPVQSLQDTHFKFNMGPKGAKFVYFISDNSKRNWFVKTEHAFHQIDSTLEKISKVFIKSDSTEIGYGFDIDETGRYWLMTKEGLMVADQSCDSFRKIPIPESFNYEPGSRNKCPVASLPDNRVLFAYGNRIFIYDENRNSFRQLTIPPVQRVNNSKVFNLILDKEKRAVFQYQGHIFRVEHDERITILWSYPDREKFIVTGLLIDQSNTLWVGVNTGGLYKINLLTPSFNSSPYKTNFVADLLIEEMQIERNELPVSWKKQEWAYDFRYFYNNQRQLFLKYDYFNYQDPRQLFSIEDTNLKPINTGESSYDYFVGIGARDEELWALGKYGWLYHWGNPTMPPSKLRIKEINSLSQERLSDFVVDEKHQWAIAVENKLYKIKDGQIIDEFTPGSGNAGLIDLCQDPWEPSILWIATLGDGLIKWDKSEQRVIYSYRKEDGLADNSIGTVVPDGNGNLWMGTFNGISRLNKKTNKITNYQKNDGLIENEFNRHHEFKLPDGRIALGGTNGYAVFDPKLFAYDTYEPKVMITSFRINNRLQSFDDSLTLIDKPLNELSHLTLNYTENSIALEVAAMQYNAPNKNNYRYKLSGYNKEWIETGKDRKIKFDQLRPGSYLLSLNTSNTDGEWSSNIHEININVSPPPWLSWWAYTIYFLIFGSSIILYWRNYKRMLIKRQEVEFNKREANRLKQMDDMKTRFFSNITHEFRTPLTLVLSPLAKQLRDQKYPKEVQHILESNYRHCSHLLKLVNELLDIAKLESGFMQTHQSTGELTVFGKECINQFEGLAKTKGINLVFDHWGIEGYYLFDKSHWDKIITNLLSNALKFTEHGEISLTLTELSKNGTFFIQIEIKDTGIGIPEHVFPSLFDRFYQVDDSATRAQEGAGIGLSLVKELTDLLNGEVAVTSTVGEGSVFSVTLPVEKISEQKVEAIPTRSAQRTTSTGSADTPVILIIEDNPELLEFIVTSFDGPWKILHAGNGQEGLEIIHNELPDVVVSDVMMPVMDGLTLCHQCKSDIRTSHIYFILLTAKTAQESKLKGLQAGADHYLTKPFQMYELELHIANALQQQSNLRDKLRAELIPEEPAEGKLKTHDPFLSQLNEYLEDNLKNPLVNVEVLASEMAMSQSTLNRKLKALLNLSAVEFIKQFRLQKAIDLLPSGKSISNIAYEVGFESPSYFSQCFKEQYEMSPTEYLNQKN